MKTYTYEEAVNYILGIPMFAEKTGHENLRAILEILEHPEERVATVHVAGTNGKGSVCLGLHAILREAGLKVGCFTSPHLTKINERFRINESDISDEAFLEAFHTVLNAVNCGMSRGGEHPSYFEFLFLMGMVWFATVGVDIAIIETGLGGRLDATNVLTPILTIITAVGYDHTQYLGETIEEIAGEKAGIIKPQVPCVYIDKEPVVTKVIAARTKEVGAMNIPIRASEIQVISATDNDLIFVYPNPLDEHYHDEDYQYKIPATAVYQCENLILAAFGGYIVLDMVLRTVSHIFNQSEEERTKIAEEYEIPILKPGYLIDGEIDYGFVADTVHEGLKHFKIPGRMELKAPHIHLDGAHNLPGIQAFAESVAKLYPNRKIVLLFAVARDKRYNEMVSCLCEKLPLTHVIVTKIHGERGTDPAALKALFGDVETECIEDITEAYEKAKTYLDGDTELFCVGSLYLIGELRKI